MPENNEVREPKDEGVVERVSKLKKAGLPIVAVVLLAIVGAPGFWEHFFDNTEDEAAAKAEISYQLLKAQTESLGKMLADYRQEMTDVRNLLNSLLLQRAVIAAGGGGGSISRPELPAARPPRQILDLPDSLDEAAAETAVGKKEYAAAGLEPME